jgi:hypothetical protein
MKGNSNFKLKPALMKERYDYIPAENTIEETQEKNGRSIFSFFKLEYEKSLDVALKLEQTKLTYQRFYIQVVSLIGAISIAFLKLKIFDNSNPVVTIEGLIGLLLIFSSVLGYAIIRNLVSIRRQCVFFNNTIIFLRREVIRRLEVKINTPTLIPVAANDRKSADYITIILYSFVNLFMLSCGFALLLKDVAITPYVDAILFTCISIIYLILHYFTIERSLQIGLNTKRTNEEDDPFTSISKLNQ